jgi:hypothetical protein
MMRFRLPPLAVGALTLLVGLNLAGALWFGRVLSHGSDANAAAGQWMPTEASANGKAPPVQRTSGTYTETLSRPVFFKDRRPYVPPPPPPPPAPPPPPQVVVVPPPPPPAPPPPPPPPPDPEFMLAGVTITLDVKRAYLAAGSGADGVWVGEGEQIEGWRVGTITETGVDLHNAGRTKRLLLFEQP